MPLTSTVSSGPEVLNTTDPWIDCHQNDLTDWPSQSASCISFCCICNANVLMTRTVPRDKHQVSFIRMDDPDLHHGLRHHKLRTISTVLFKAYCESICPNRETSEPRCPKTESMGAIEVYATAANTLTSGKHTQFMQCHRRSYKQCGHDCLNTTMQQIALSTRVSEASVTSTVYCHSADPTNHTKDVAA